MRTITLQEYFGSAPGEFSHNPAGFGLGCGLNISVRVTYRIRLSLLDWWASVPFQIGSDRLQQQESQDTQGLTVVFIEPRSSC
ncbi:hypothetical protein CFAM422_010832 [Trichoderma lentiforme]|uniref:Uncharacterized protein n=1 Tax=Trichoderma lentiforme TaxID=1567552 RepID=A0A9P4X7L4_9HYPO|nr:hypothetical protein CFAM422_010832 [Trichoderma lentiforme]